MNLCACGCGQIPRVATRSCPRRGHVKGQPYQYVNGHQNRGRCTPKRKRQIKGYRIVGGIVDGRHGRLVHQLRAEKALGKPLPRGAVVHHADGSRDENAPLVICQDQSYHRLLHYRMRVKAAGGNPNTDRLCCICGPQPVTEFDLRSDGRYYRTHCRTHGTEGHRAYRRRSAA